MRYLVLVLLLSSCGSAYHLKRAKMHLLKAEAKGATINSDTVYITKEVIVPQVQVDTLLRITQDTITISEDRVLTKILIDTVTNTVFVSSTCLPDTVRIKVPVLVETEIKAKGLTGFKLVGWLFLAFLAGAILSRLFWR